jgi:hypothetical protein
MLIFQNMVLLYVVSFKHGFEHGNLGIIIIYLFYNLYKKLNKMNDQTRYKKKIKNVTYFETGRSNYVGLGGLGRIPVGSAGQFYQVLPAPHPPSGRSRAKAAMPPGSHAPSGGR